MKFRRPRNGSKSTYLYPLNGSFSSSSVTMMKVFTTSFFSQNGYKLAAGEVAASASMLTAISSTSSMLLGMCSGSMFSVLKKTSRAFVIAVSKLAMIVLVLIATSIEPDLSPITTTGDSNGKLQTRNCILFLS